MLKPTLLRFWILLWGSKSSEGSGLHLVAVLMELRPDHRFMVEGLGFRVLCIGISIRV